MSVGVSIGQLKFSLRYASFSGEAGGICPVFAGLPKEQIFASSTGMTWIADVSVTSPIVCIGLRNTG